MKIKLMHSVSPATEKTGPIAQFQSDDFIFVAELMNCDVDSFEEGKEYEADVKFYCHEIYGIYKDEEEFHKDNPNMAEQSYIPVGAFPVSKDDKNWKPSPMNLINSIVGEVVDNEVVDAPNNLVLFYGKVYDKTIDQVLYYETEEDKADVKAGDIVSGLYWVELILESGEDVSIC